MRYFDIGVNLSSEQFAKDRADVVCRAQSAGVENILLIGSNIDDSRQAIALAHTFNLTASAGIHPHDAKTAQGNYCETIASLASDSAVVAIGECGLDYNRDFSPRDKQREVFAAQVALANKLNKPLYMHQRDAHQDFLAIVKEAEVPGVVHCFTDSEQALEAYLELGFYIGITGWLCDERRGDTLRQLLPRIPLDKLLFETDAPYLLPRNIKPKPKSRRCEPMHITHVVAQAAELYGLPVEEVADAAFNNAHKLFALEVSACD
ncbi:Tat-linked quality control protein TatD [Pseudoalteromonas sp. P1-9]|uniref:TatD family hydrolase n=1 Tax=Pseudoalteromonas sp. P1-9 TaxID=1710354 RepID=UPI0006D63D07|nr:TatD family hydrolase [Pseudoalteromonas sp. P1-9]KPV98081.1 Tat-linked quality control protein TatD [Pseudoalteromonas sp. P1-9]